MLRSVVLIRTEISQECIANVVPSALILFTLIMEAIRSSETSVITWATRCHIPEDGILHRHCRENKKILQKDVFVTLLQSVPLQIYDFLVYSLQQNILQTCICLIHVLLPFISYLPDCVACIIGPCNDWIITYQKQTVISTNDLAKQETCLNGTCK
jgi:hypothetical protein